jgi:hypothetical protein
MWMRGAFGVIITVVGLVDRSSGNGEPSQLSLAECWAVEDAPAWPDRRAAGGA